MDNCCLIVSDDCYFFDAVISSNVVRQKFKFCMKSVLGIDFDIHVQGLRDVVDTLKDA